MEFLRKAESKGPLSCDTVLKIFYQTCRAVQHMHRQKPPIIHRDLKVGRLPLCLPCSLRGGPAHPDGAPLPSSPPALRRAPLLSPPGGGLPCGQGCERSWAWTPVWSQEEVTSPALLWAGALPACCQVLGRRASPRGCRLPVVHTGGCPSSWCRHWWGRGLRGHDFVFSC